jgi:hypothetical protein
MIISIDKESDGYKFVTHYEEINHERIHHIDTIRSCR